VLEVVAPELALQPGQEKTYCYYTTLGNPEAIGVQRFQSSMTAGSHHLILFTTGEPIRPQGTVEECGLLANRRGRNPAAIPVWVYAAQEPEAEMPMPAGVGMALDARQPVVVQMHYFNAGGQVLRPRVTIRIHPHTETGWVQARPFVTYDTTIQVPAYGTGEVRGECVLPQGAKFFLMSTHSHRFTTRARILDGESIVVETTDWDHPTVGRWSSEPFYEFRSRYLTYECTYQNPTPRTVETGDSAQTDEMCMAVGYFFPATGLRFCIDGFVLPF
jgi:hypothetical protein